VEEKNWGHFDKTYKENIADGLDEEEAFILSTYLGWSNNEEELNFTNEKKGDTK